MAFDGVTVADLTCELNNRLNGAFINRVIQPEKDEIYLSFKGQGGNQILYLSANASLPLAYLTDSAPSAPLSAPAFCMLLRKHIQGGRITDISQPGLDRIIRFDIEHRNEMGDLCTKTLIAELMGKHSNIILTDENDVVIDAIKRINAATSSVRQVLPGREYFIPDTLNKKDPLNEERDPFIKTVSSFRGEVSKALYTGYKGISPVFSEEICFEAGIDGGSDASSLDTSALSALFEKFSLRMNDIKNCSFRPAIIYINNEPKEFGSLPYTIFNAGSVKTFDSMSDLLKTYYSEKNRITRMKQRSADLRHITSTALARAVKKLSLQEKQLADTSKMDRYKLYGELLNAYGYGIKDCGDSVILKDFTTGEDISVPLKKELSPYENAQRYFDRYNKLKRTKVSVTEQIASTKNEIEMLDSILTNLDIAEDESDLSGIREELVLGGFVKATSKQDRKNKRKPVSSPMCFRASSGSLIYVGKNNIQNEEITFKTASPSDWWFHAKQMPGSHVILKTEGKDIPDSDFEEAARLAAHFSKGRDSKKVEVDYIQRKHIKKPKHASPGFVIYHTNFSVTADTDISGIERVNK